MTHFWIAFGLFWLATVPAALLLLAVGLYASASRSAEVERQEQDDAMWSDIVAALKDES